MIIGAGSVPHARGTELPADPLAFLRRRSLLGRMRHAPLLWRCHYAILRRHCGRLRSAIAATRMTHILFMKGGNDAG